MRVESLIRQIESPMRHEREASILLEEKCIRGKIVHSVFSGAPGMEWWGVTSPALEVHIDAEKISHRGKMRLYRTGKK